jgi:hypothetical protein
MWMWFFIGYGTFVATLVGYAAHVAITGKGRQRRADAFKVLKLILTTTTGAIGLLGIVLRFYQLGLI